MDFNLYNFFIHRKCAFYWNKSNKMKIKYNSTKSPIFIITKEIIHIFFINNFKKLKKKSFKMVYLISSAERRILTQKRIETRAEVPRVASALVVTRSRVKIRSARDTNDIFCSLYTES